MDAVSNVGVWMDKIYMGERRRGGGSRMRRGVVISLKHGGGSQTGMGSVISYRRHGVYMEYFSEAHLTAQDFSIW